MTDFNARKRERFLEEDVYRNFRKASDTSIAFDRELLKSKGAELEAGDNRHVDWRWGIASGLLEMSIGRYSAGDAVPSLAADFSSIITAIEAAALPHAYRTEPFYLDEIDTYAYAMWLLSLCKLLRLDPLLPRVAALFDVARDDNRGRDALFEALLDKLGLPSVPTKGMLKNLKAHPLLLQAIEAEPRKKSLYVAEFLKAWYPAMKGAYWYDRHRRVPQNFFGYWAFEAGLVTYLWDIDDSAYRHLPFYPKDLVDYARAHPEIAASVLDATDAQSSPSSVPAGQPCPREGWWSTPAMSSGRRRFKTGELMPAIESDYGVTIWQWDSNQQP